MKILLANKFFYPRGGESIHTIGLKKLLEAHGHQVAVYSMQFPENIPNDYSGYWPSTIEFPPRTLHQLKETFFRPVSSREVKRTWNRLLDDFKPDVVHLHNIHTQLSPVIAKEATKRQIPVFWTLHDYKPVCPVYTFMRDGKICEECLTNKFSVVRHRCIKKSLPGSVLGYIESKVWSLAKLQEITTKFISPSRFLMDKMTEAGLSSHKITHIYNFADDEKFKPVVDKKNYAVCLGRLSKEKGVETLIQATTSLPDFQLKIIGDGPLKNELKEKYPATNIEFKGYLPWEKIQTLLGHARFMIIPSEWYENNPLSVIEAFSLGTPVLGANIGGIPELINPGNGRLFQPGNADDLKDKILEMMQTSTWDYPAISVSAKKIFSPEKFYTSLLNEYQLKV